MCVTCAIKLPRDRDTGKPTEDAQWVLFKIRDRAYDPLYTFKTYNDGKRTSLYLVDEDSDWTECIRTNNTSGDTELMFVNSALNNTMDKKDGTSKSRSSETSGRKIADHGLVARRVARTEDLDGAVKAFTEMKFDGCTFISDGTRCILIESSLPAEIKKKIQNKGGTKRSAADAEDFVTTTEEVRGWLAVRTNHGITNEDAGYQEKDGTSYESSTRRRKYAEKIIKERIFEVSDIIPTIDYMGDPEVDKNPFYRPRRIHSEIQEWMKKHSTACEIYSTSAFVLTASGNILVKLYDAEISKVNIQRLYSKDFPIRVSISR